MQELRRLLVGIAVLTVVLVVGLVIQDYLSPVADGATSAGGSTASTGSTAAPIVVQIRAGVPRALLAEGRTPIPQGYSAHGFYARAARGPVQVSDCLAAGGIPEPRPSNWTLRRSLAPGVLIVYHQQARRELLLVGFSSPGPIPPVYELNSCLFELL